MPEQPYQFRGSRFAKWLDLHLIVQDDTTMQATITLREEQEGPPLHAHGGVSASILDEAMGMAVWESGIKVLAANLNVNYRQPVPLGVELQVFAEIVRIEGRKAFTRGEIRLPDGSVAVESTGIFVDVSQTFLKDAILGRDTTLDN